MFWVSIGGPGTNVLYIPRDNYTITLLTKKVNGNSHFSY